MGGIPKSIPADLRLPVEMDLRLILRMAVQSLGRRSATRSDRLDAEIAAERIIEAIRKFNYVILQGPPIPISDISKHPKMGNWAQAPAEELVPGE